MVTQIVRPGLGSSGRSVDRGNAYATYGQNDVSCEMEGLQPLTRR
jgi:hypothetical protein